MARTPEQMREYQRQRRAALKREGGSEGEGAQESKGEGGSVRGREPVSASAGTTAARSPETPRATPIVRTSAPAAQPAQQPARAAARGTERTSAALGRKYALLPSDIDWPTVPGKVQERILNAMNKGVSAGLVY